MAELRYALLIMWVGCLAWFAYFVAHERISGMNPQWPLIAIPAFCILNLAYVYFSTPLYSLRKGRLSRLVSLWFEAKEAELKRRAGQNPPQSN